MKVKHVNKKAIIIYTILTYRSHLVDQWYISILAE